YIAVIVRGLSDLRVRTPPGADLALVIDIEHHEADPSLAVILDVLSDRQALARLEVLRGLLIVSPPDLVGRMPAGDLGVNVNIHSHQILYVHDISLAA